MITLLIREIIFRLSQCIWSQSTNVTDGRTDRQTTYGSNTAALAHVRLSVCLTRQLEIRADLKLFTFAILL